MIAAGELNDTDIAGLRLMQIHTVNLDSATSCPVTKQLPPDCPSWAANLNDCEVHAVFIICSSLLSVFLAIYP